MARGRIISTTLGRSRKFNRLTDHFAKLVYIHTLTSADEQGRIEADTIAIYGDHFVADPEASLERIDAALIEMHHVGLVQLYEVDGKRYAEFVDFEVHNTIRRDKDGNPTREGRSRIPPPPSDRAEPVQTPRGPRAETSPQVEVEVEVQDQVEGEGDRDHSEDRMARAFATGQPQSSPKHRVRAELRRLAGPDFTQRHEQHLDAWTRWSDEQLRAMWEASDPARWPGETHKKRAWILKDLLDEERPMPRTHQADDVGRSFAEILAEAQRDLGVN